MDEKEQVQKITKLYELMYILFHMKIMKQNLKGYFDNRGYHSVVVYGMGNLGKILVEELTSENINVKYAIDKRADDIYYAIDIYKPEDNCLEKVDVIVITTVTCFSDIKMELSEKFECDIVSIEEMIKECL